MGIEYGVIWCAVALGLVFCILLVGFMHERKAQLREYEERQTARRDRKAA